MKRRRFNHSLLAGGAAFTAGVLSGCVLSPSPSEPPPLPRELRAAWVATVANIDWPSRPGLSTAEQQAEMLVLLDQARRLGLNAIVLQVRPSADALYASSLEPWSEFLSGRQGRAPEPFYDPLALWIDEAHRRGLELHAWINPYRARHASARSEPSAGHVSRTRPELVRRYASELWLDPGEPGSTAHTLAVVSDLVARYDIDALHIDDYFYPYPVGDASFPDDASWQRYRAGGGTLARDDWRRDNVSRLVQALDREIHRIKPWVRFGISPFGLGRTSLRPAEIKGFDPYERLYADAEMWLREGWLDYCAPQLYWPIGQTPQAFGTLLAHWTAQNRKQRHLWPGLFTSSVNDTPSAWTASEIADQIALTRAHGGASGHIHFSMVALLQDRKGVASLLGDTVYASPALPPATPWLEADAPAAPLLSARVQPGATRLQIAPASGKPALRFALWLRHGARWQFIVQPAHEPVLTLPDDPTLGRLREVVARAVCRVSNASEPVRLTL